MNFDIVSPARIRIPAKAGINFEHSNFGHSCLFIISIFVFRICVFFWPSAKKTRLYIWLNVRIWYEKSVFFEMLNGAKSISQKEIKFFYFSRFLLSGMFIFD